MNQNIFHQCFSNEARRSRRFVDKLNRDLIVFQLHTRRYNVIGHSIFNHNVHTGYINFLESVKVVHTKITCWGSLVYLLHIRRVCEAKIVYCLNCYCLNCTICIFGYPFVYTRYIVIKSSSSTRCSV